MNLQITDEIIAIKGFLLHGDGPTFMERLNIRPESFPMKLAPEYMTHSLHNFDVSGIEDVVDCWNNLAPGEAERCFTPGYRLEFYTSSRLLFKAAICWACNNIRVECGVEKSRNGYSFDATSVNAEKLLNLLRESCEKSI
jgi:hypothetical protein